MAKEKLIFPYFSNRTSTSLFNLAGILRFFAGIFLIYHAIVDIPQNLRNPGSNLGLLGFSSLQTLECLGRIPYVWDKIYARYQLFAICLIYFIVSVIYSLPYIKKIFMPKDNLKTKG